MKQTQLYCLCLVAGLGFAAPVAAQQSMMHGRDGMMGGGMLGGGMMGGGMMGGGMMGGGMMGGGMMSGMNSYAMRMFDANKDGTLTPEEMTKGMQAEIKTYDADKNGSLSLAEFEAMHAAHTRTMMVRAFQMHDEDGDGQVTEAEIATVATMMQMMMAGAKGGPGMHGAGKGGMMDDN